VPRLLGTLPQIPEKGRGYKREGGRGMNDGNGGVWSEGALPYLTLPSGWAGYYTCPALRPYQFGPMRNPDVTIRSQ